MASEPMSARERFADASLDIWTLPLRDDAPEDVRLIRTRDAERIAEQHADAAVERAVERARKWGLTEGVLDHLFGRARMDRLRAQAVARGEGDAEQSTEEPCRD